MAEIAARAVSARPPQADVFSCQNSVSAILSSAKNQTGGGNMPPIFVNTENDPKDKLYVGTNAGTAAAEAETKMQTVLKKIIDANAGFTTNKIANAKGYSIRLKVAKVTVDGGETSCGLSGEILLYPKSFSVKGAHDQMLSTAMNGHAKASGTDKQAILDCVEAITESLAKKAMPIMTADMAKRN
jgi:hypothetical protein